jgi:acetyl/propionyl-CoA carboxylase alpha subunit
VYETVLVASRGPVACAVVRTCQRLGVRAVTVHSEGDAEALHVRTADDSVLIGPAPPEQSYLDPRRVVEAARSRARRRCTRRRRARPSTRPRPAPCSTPA